MIDIKAPGSASRRITGGRDYDALAQLCSAYGSVSQARGRGEAAIVAGRLMLRIARDRSRP